MTFLPRHNHPPPGKPKAEQANLRAASLAELEELCRLCREGRLYDVERWVRAGKPIQAHPPTTSKLGKQATPLQIAVGLGFHSLAELLLLNGYDPNGDYYECLAPAVEAKNHSMVELLLQHKADPNAVGFETVLETYDRRMMDLFVNAGVDPCADHSVARALRHKKAPHLGFVKSFSGRFPGLIRQASIALRKFVEKGDLKGVSLMLWLGAAPYEDVPESDGDCEEEGGYQQCALAAAAAENNQKIIAMLLKVPIPAEKAQLLLRKTAHAANPLIIARLLALGADPNDYQEGRHILIEMVNHATWRFGRHLYPEHEDRGIEAIKQMAEAGAKLDLDEKALPTLRRRLLDGESRVVSSIVEIFRRHRVLSEHQLHELTRTAGMKRVLSGYTKPYRDPFTQNQQTAAPPAYSAPPKPGYWKRHWWQR